MNIAVQLKPDKVGIILPIAFASGDGAFGDDAVGAIIGAAAPAPALPSCFSTSP